MRTWAPARSGDVSVACDDGVVPSLADSNKVELADTM